MGKGGHFPGRPRLFETPENLWDMFIEYVNWAKDNPWIKKEPIKTGDDAGTLIDIPHERPLTIWEFVTFIGMSRSCFEAYCQKKEFVIVCKTIKDRMTAQRVSGGLTGAYNANLVARIDGITDKQEIDNTHIFPTKMNINFTKAPKDDE
jgi:hypothetical protein